MERQLEAYCAHLRNERQVSEHTLLGYRRDLAKVVAYCNEHGIAGWQALQIQQLRQLIARQHHHGQSARSLARLLSAVRGLYRYLNREGLCQHDPASGLSPPKGERRLPKVLDTDRALQLLDGGVDDEFIARRDQAILELFYSSGLRLSELTNLDLDHLDLAAGLVQVLGKGGKARDAAGWPQGARGAAGLVPPARHGQPARSRGVHHPPRQPHQPKGRSATG